MNKEEFTSKREQMLSVKRNAIIAVSKVVRLFTDADIKDFIVTGSQALIIQGFMFHRNGDDVDVRVLVPMDEDKRRILMQKLQAWALLYREKDISEKYTESMAKQMFTFYVRNTKVNVFALSEEDYKKIPYNIIQNEYSAEEVSTVLEYKAEEVGSVLLDKLNLKRGKDYGDFIKCITNFGEICL